MDNKRPVLTCRNCLKKWRGSAHWLGPHYAKTWNELDRLLPRYTIVTIRCILRQVESWDDKLHWVRDVCGSCFIKLIKSYRQLHYDKRKVYFTRNKQQILKRRSSICPYGHKRTKYNCNTCRMLIRHAASRRQKDLMRKYYREQTARQTYGQWVPVWKAWRQLKKETKLCQIN